MTSNNADYHEVLSHEGDYPASKPLLSYLFLAFLVLSFVMAAYVLVVHREKVATDKTSVDDFFKGAMAFSFEKKFEEALPVREPIIGTMGALTYGVFNTGRDGVVLGQDGWYFSKEEFETWKGADEAEKSKLTFIKQVHDFLARKNIALVVALVPSKARVYEEKLGAVMLPATRRDTYDRFLAAVQAAGVTAPNLEIVLREGKAKEPMFMHTDTHWTPAGANLVAQALAQTITDTMKLTLEPKQAFATTVGEEKPYDGDLLRYVKTGAFRALVGPQGEKVNGRSTDVVASAEGAGGDLFGDKIVPVTLVGTSYSFQKDWHFDGFLKVALGADVLNMAEEGKGPIEPMVTYLKKTDFSTNPPKVVIWEIPERFIPKTYDVKLPDVSGDVVKEVK